MPRVQYRYAQLIIFLWLSWLRLLLTASARCERECTRSVDKDTPLFKARALWLRLTAKHKVHGEKGTPFTPRIARFLPLCACFVHHRAFVFSSVFHPSFFFSRPAIGWSNNAKRTPFAGACFQGTRN